jgi:hypothetical protein
MRRWLVVVTVLVVAAAALVLLMRQRHTTRAPHPAAAELRERMMREQERAREGAPAVTASQPARPKLTPEARARLLAALERAQAARGPAAAPAPTPGGGTMPVLRADGGVVGSLDKEYIRAAIRELIPLVHECYENALRDRPDLGGRLTVEFRIAGEPAIGGVVTESRIAETDAGTLHAGLEECVRETMYGLKLAAPAGGGTVKVRYPFVFRTR